MNHTKKCLQLSLIALVFGLFFGCSDGDGKTDKTTDQSADTDSSNQQTGIEIFSWWTSPGEAEALQALIDEFTLEYPTVSVVNVSAELGHGKDAREELADRMANDNPPDVFQLGPRDFDTWVHYDGKQDDNRLEPLDALFQAENWTDLYPQGVLDVLKYEGHYYAVPVNMHRQNSLFYNKELVTDPPTTMAEFLSLAADLDSQGVIPLAVSAGTGGWTLEIIFFSIMSGTAGAQYHDDFYSGRIDLSDADNLASLTQSVDNYLTLMGYANTNADQLGWDDAAGLLLDGTAAMYIHGDWAKGYYTSTGWEPGVDFGAAPVPGSEDEFIYNVDTFALPVGAQNRDEALDFLRVVGSAEAQGAFNQLKGSTPVHPDVDISNWDEVATATKNHLDSATVLHNVEIHQFSVPAANPDDPPVGMGDQLLALFQGDLTKQELIDWIVSNYTAGTAGVTGK